MTHLCGKGIWLAHSYDLERAAEMSTSMDGTHLLIKVGHGPHYFPETAKDMVHRVRTLGLYPLAWVRLTDRAPQAACKAVVEALNLGYQAVVLFLSSDVVGARLADLTEELINVEIPRDRLILASPPLSHLPHRQALEALVPACQGGWMPLCSAEWGEDATYVIDHDVYQALGDLSLIWGKSPDIYPVLSPVQPPEETPLPESFIPWIQGIASHGVDFFSIYHAANTEKAIWPMVQAINVACLEANARAATATATERPTASTVAQPVYVTVKASDTVWGLISRHALTRERFWGWNAHLWDSRGLPRDPDYLQEGWRIRVK